MLLPGVIVDMISSVQESAGICPADGPETGIEWTEEVSVLRRALCQKTCFAERVDL